VAPLISIFGAHQRCLRDVLKSLRSSRIEGRHNFLASRRDPELAAAAFARGASPTACGGQSVVLGKPLIATFSPFCRNRFAELVFVVSFNFYLVLLNIVDGFGYNDRV